MIASFAGAALGSALPGLVITVRARRKLTIRRRAFDADQRVRRLASAQRAIASGDPAVTAVGQTMLDLYGQTS